MIQLYPPRLFEPARRQAFRFLEVGDDGKVRRSSKISAVTIIRRRRSAGAAVNWAQALLEAA